MSDFRGYGGDDLPDPKELLRKLKSNASYLILAVIAALVVIGLLNSYYTVEADERAVVLRLGKPTGEVMDPGLHFRIPVIDRVYKAKTTKIRQLEFGFRTERADVRSRVNEDVREEGLMLTGDLELVNVQWTVLYRVGNIEDFLFQVRDVETTIRDISEAAVRVLVGDRASDEVMMTNREEVALRAQELIQLSLDRCNSGIVVESVALRQVEPPPQAQEAFNKVNEARARKQQTIELAKREKEAKVSPMLGRKEAIIAQARGRRDQEIKEATGEAERFRQVLAEYRKYPDITKRWLYLEAMQRVWHSVGQKYVMDGSTSPVPLLPLGQFGPLGQGGAVAPKGPMGQTGRAGKGGAATWPSPQTYVPSMAAPPAPAHTRTPAPAARKGGDAK